MKSISVQVLLALTTFKLGLKVAFILMLIQVGPDYGYLKKSLL